MPDRNFVFTEIMDLIVGLTSDEVRDIIDDLIVYEEGLRIEEENM